MKITKEIINKIKVKQKEVSDKAKKHPDYDNIMKEARKEWEQNSEPKL